MYYLAGRLFFLVPSLTLLAITYIATYLLGSYSYYSAPLLPLIKPLYCAREVVEDDWHVCPFFSVVAQSSSRVKGDRQDEGSSSGGESTQDHEVMPRMQPALPQYVVPCGVLSQSGQVESVRDKSSHIGGHFADKGVAPLEPLVEYSEDALGNEVMVESEASVVTGSALALSDNSGDEVQRTSFSSSVSIGNLIAESYALCRDGAVNGSEVLEHDSVQPERIAATVGGECEDAARYGVNARVCLSLSVCVCVCMYACLCIRNCVSSLWYVFMLLHCDTSSGARSSVSVCVYKWKLSVVGEDNMIA